MDSLDAINTAEAADSTEAHNAMDGAKSLDGIKGFIFDCDGTILDSMGAWDAAEEEIFQTAGPMDPAVEEEIHLLPLEEAVKRFHFDFGVGESPEAVMDHIDSGLMRYYAEECELLPGAAEYVRKVADAGIPMVILSSSPMRYLEPGLRHVGLLDYFKAIITTDDTGFAKNDRRIYEHAMEIMGSGPGSTWGADDNPGAVKTMEATGVRTIGIGEETKGFATIVVENLGELV